MNEQTKFLDVHIFYDPGDFADVDVLTYVRTLLIRLANASSKNGYSLGIGEILLFVETTLKSSAVSSQHQTHVIREVRTLLGLRPGDRIEWVLRNGEILVRRARK